MKLHLFRKPDWFLIFLVGVSALAQGALMFQFLDSAPAAVQDATWLVVFTLLGFPYLLSVFFLYRWLAMGLTVLMIVATLVFGQLIVLDGSALGWPFHPGVFSYEVLKPWQILYALVWLPVTTGVLMTQNRKQLMRVLEFDDLVRQRKERLQQLKDDKQNGRSAAAARLREEMALLDAENAPEALPAPQLPVVRERGDA